MVLPHANCVRLLYASGSVGGADLSPARLLKAALRLRPDRIVPQELRDPDASFAYVSGAATGHPGSLSTVHGADAPQAARRLFNLLKGSAEGAAIQDATLIDMLATTVDLIVPVSVLDSGRRALGEVWFADDAARRSETFADLLRAH